MAAANLTPSEHAEQATVIAWADIMAARFPCLRLLYAVPNGARTGMRTAVKLKLEGLKAGVPDLCLPAARCGFHGLYIEMKRVKGGVVSGVQADWHDALRLAGYAVAVCRGASEAQDLLTSYCSGNGQSLGRWFPLSQDGLHDSLA